ncbi:unnamed protein product [Meganyctiphanes norvegica]|uniref:Uncharacterized protein n=1 Tax=Meganyctiphanes norvegica TaxID=48144 RepID=A0AAV2QDQ9_MEGNR
MIFGRVLILVTLTVYHMLRLAVCSSACSFLPDVPVFVGYVHFPLGVRVPFWHRFQSGRRWPLPAPCPALLVALGLLGSTCCPYFRWPVRHGFRKSLCLAAVVLDFTAPFTWLVCRPLCYGSVMVHPVFLVGAVEYMCGDMDHLAHGRVPG